MKEAIENAQKYRYKGDVIGTLSNPTSYKLDFIENDLARNSLNINKELVPEIEKTLSEVCNVLLLDRNRVQGYVYSSTELQAYCYSVNFEECIIQISSSLIELLDENELKFVLGHEIGHFLLGHGVVHKEENQVNMFSSRSQELSADRIGVLASNDEKAGHRAIIKIASGLSTEYLRFDVNKFLKQLNNVKIELGENYKNTHPSLLVRSRAILWFNIFLKQDQNIRTKDELDDRIDSDLKKYLDGPKTERIKELEESYSFWNEISQMLKDKKFDKTEQNMISNNFGQEALDKIKNLIKISSINELNYHIDQQLKTIREELNQFKS